jgi:hypothetical protein
MFPAMLLVYLLFPTKNYYWDGIFFARVIEDASTLNPSLLHPNHLAGNGLPGMQNQRLSMRGVIVATTSSS